MLRRRRSSSRANRFSWLAMANTSSSAHPSLQLHRPSLAMIRARLNSSTRENGR